MTSTLALAGDTMLGRGVGEILSADPTAPLFAPEVEAQITGADAFILNLECCVSDRGSRFPDPRKPFFFRAPPIAAERLAGLGVDAVTLANNHVLDYGPLALADTLAHLDAAGILAVGAGSTAVAARAPRSIHCGDVRLGIVAFTDHPSGYAAGVAAPGVAFAALDHGVPVWVHDAIRADTDADAVLVTPHWGPNMVAAPIPRVRRAADALLDAGATLIAGHSAHVFQGVAPRVLFDLGDFIDDYAVDPHLRNDLGLLWLIEFESPARHRIKALPLGLDYAFTRRAAPSEAGWIQERLTELCAPFGTEVARTPDGLIEFHHIVA